MTYKFVLRPFVRSDNSQKLSLRVTHNRQSKFLDVVMDHQKIYLTKDEFSSLGISSKKYLRKVSRHLQSEHKRIQDIMSEIQAFSFDEFVGKYYRSNLLSDMFKEKIQELKDTNKFSSMEAYTGAMKSFIDYRDIAVTEIDMSYIKGYIKAKGERNPYLRMLRHILRRSGSTLEIHISGKQKRRQSLTPEEVKKLREYKTIHKARQRYVDLWLMSYFGGGMNTKDWVFLKEEEIKGEFIDKSRMKTGEATMVPIIKSLKLLIDKYRVYGNEYVFDFIDHSLAPEAKHKRYKTFISNFRRELEIVRKELGIESKLTPYVARNTHANVLLNKGASTKAIQESLGHKSIKTTEHYLGSLYSNTRMDTARMLEEE